MLNRHKVMAALAVFVIATSGCSLTEPPGKGEEATPVQATKAAPDIDLPLEKTGPPTRLSSLRGKVVVLDFWATWCGPCRMSMPDLEKIYEKYKSQGVTVIGIAEDDARTSAGIPSVKKQLGIKYPTVLASDIPDVESDFPHPSIPVLYVIDQKGDQVFSAMGYNPGMGLSDVESKIQELLKK